MEFDGEGHEWMGEVYETSWSRSRETECGNEKVVVMGGGLGLEGFDMGYFMGSQGVKWGKGTRRDAVRGKA